MKPGMYEVMEDVANPKPDRRKSDGDFSALPKWQKGLRVCVEIEESENPLHPNRATIFRAGGYRHLGVTGREGGAYKHPGFDALVAALRPVEWTNEEWVKVHINNGNFIIVRLLESGKITKDDVRDALSSS